MKAMFVPARRLLCGTRFYTLPSQVVSLGVKNLHISTNSLQKQSQCCFSLLKRRGRLVHVPVMQEISVKTIFNSIQCNRFECNNYAF